MNFFKKISFLFLTFVLFFMMGVNVVEADWGDDTGVIARYAYGGNYPGYYVACGGGGALPVNPEDIAFEQWYWNWVYGANGNYGPVTDTTHESDVRKKGYRIWRAVCIDGYDGTEGFWHSEADVTPTEGYLQGFCQAKGYDKAEAPPFGSTYNHAPADDPSSAPDPEYNGYFSGIGPYSLNNQPKNSWVMELHTGCRCDDGNVYDEGSSSCVPSSQTPTISLTADPSSITLGGSSNLTWQTSDIISGSCRLDNSIGSVSDNNNSGRSVSPGVDTTYKLTCDYTNGSNNEWEIGVCEREISCSQDYNSQSCDTLLNNSYSIGSKVTCCAETDVSCDYTYVANTDNKSSISDTAQVIVNTLPASLKIKANGDEDSTTIIRNQVAKLTWTSTNVKDCYVDPIGPGPVEELVGWNPYPQVDTTYTISCTKTKAAGSGPISSSVIVYVTEPTINASCGTADFNTDWSRTYTPTEIAGSSYLCGTGNTVGSVPAQYTDTEPTHSNYLNRWFWWRCNGTAPAPNNTAVCYAPKTPTISLTPPSQTIPYGGSATLTLETENLKNCTSNQSDLIPNVPTPEMTTRDYSVSPTTDTIYTVSCVDSWNGAPYSATAEVKVKTPDPATLTLTANPTTIWKGDSSTLSWTTSNVQSCSIMVGVNSVYNIPSANLASGSISQTPNNTTTYRLNCLDLSGSVKSVPATVTVEPLPTVNLEIKKSGGSYEPDDELDIVSGDGVDLKWSSTNATSCIGPSSYNPTNLPSGNYGGIKPTSNTAYNIACSKTINGNSTKWDSDGVIVNVAPPAAPDPVCGIASDQDGSWNFYDSVTDLQYSTDDGDLCSVGSVYQNPAEDVDGEVTNFKWSCSNIDGDAVACWALKTPTVFLTPPSQIIDYGSSADLTLETQNITSCTSNQPDLNPTVNTAALTSEDFTVTPPVTTDYDVTCATVYTGVPNQPVYTDTAQVIVNPQPGVSTLDLFASDTNIYEGEKITLNWASTNLENCSIDADNGSDYGSVSPSNTTGPGLEVTPTAPITEYFISCDWVAGTTSGPRGDSVMVSVNVISPFTVDLQIRKSGTSVYAPDDVVNLTGSGDVDFNWSETEADNGSCYISPALTIGYLPGATVQNIGGITHDTTTNYTLTCTKTTAGITQTATDDAIVNVTGPLPQGTIKLTNSGPIDRGGTAILSWTGNDVENCSIKPGIGSVDNPPSNTQTPVLNSNETYKITCEDTNYSGTPRESETTVVVDDFDVDCKNVSPISGSISTNNPDELCSFNPSGINGSVDGFRINTNEDKFEWSCIGENSEGSEKSASCDATCDGGYIPDPDPNNLGSCIINPDITIEKWDVDPNIVNEGDKCLAEWEVLDPGNNGIKCDIQGSSGFNKTNVGLITGTDNELNPGQNYRLYCYYGSVTATESWEKCILNPDIEEF